MPSSQASDTCTYHSDHSDRSDLQSNRMCSRLPLGGGPARAAAQGGSACVQLGGRGREFASACRARGGPGTRAPGPRDSDWNRCPGLGRGAAVVVVKGHAPLASGAVPGGPGHIPCGILDSYAWGIRHGCHGGWHVCVHSRAPALHAARCAPEPRPQGTGCPLRAARPAVWIARCDRRHAHSASARLHSDVLDDTNTEGGGAATVRRAQGHYPSLALPCALRLGFRCGAGGCDGVGVGPRAALVCAVSRVTRVDPKSESGPARPAPPRPTAPLHRAT